MHNKLICKMNFYCRKFKNWWLVFHQRFRQTISQRIQMSVANDTFGALHKAFRRFEKQIPPPKLINVKGGNQFRYKEKLVEQALVQKLARYISSLHAAFLLWQHGFVQEQAAVQRILDEINEDIYFLTFAITNDKITPLHEKYLEEFYGENFTDNSDPVGTVTPYKGVRRPEIRKYLDEKMGNIDAGRATEVAKTLTRVYSGYIHADSASIMDMYGGGPPRFHIQGMLGTPRIEEHEYDLWNYFYRGILSAVGVGKALGDEETIKGLYAYALEFEKVLGRDFGASEYSK